jgi:hypothetical protein
VESYRMGHSPLGQQCAGLLPDGLPILGDAPRAPQGIGLRSFQDDWRRSRHVLICFYAILPEQLRVEVVEEETPCEGATTYYLWGFTVHLNAFAYT